MTMTNNFIEDLHALLIKKKLTIATAESLTAGMIAAELASLSGSSAYLRGGVVAYNLDAKVSLLGVDRAMAEACNCVSAAMALQMAQGARKQFGTDCAIAVTGYAEPHAGGEPFAHYVLLYKDQEVVSGIILGGDRSRNRMRRLVTNAVIDEMFRLLETV